MSDATTTNGDIMTVYPLPVEGDPIRCGRGCDCIHGTASESWEVNEKRVKLKAGQWALTSEGRAVNADCDCDCHAIARRIHGRAL